MTTIREMYGLVGGYCGHLEAETKYIAIWNNPRDKIESEAFVVCQGCNDSRIKNYDYYKHLKMDVPLTLELETALKLIFTTLTDIDIGNHQVRRASAGEFIWSYVNKNV